MRLGAVSIDRGDAYWLEGRALEGGRNVLMRGDAEGVVSEVTPPGSNVRSRVHEYGGGAYVVRDRHVVFSEFADSRLYRLAPAGGAPVALTPPGPWRYADASMHPSGGWFVCVREDHSADGREPSNSIVRIDMAGEPSPGVILVGGYDFLATPRLSPDGTRLLWLAWRHPQMPWDGTELWVADVTPGGALRHAQRIAGSAHESIFQPGWLPDGRVCFVSDRSGWWNLYRDAPGGAEPLHPMEAEFGQPLWQFEMSTWASTGDRIVAAHRRGGHWVMGLIAPGHPEMAPFAPSIEPGPCIAADDRSVVCVSKSPRAADAVVRIDRASGGVQVLRRASESHVDPAYLSYPQAIEFPTIDGATAHALYYAPCSAAADPPAGERPPLIVLSHGGPTTSAVPDFNLGVQFWTSRGFAVVDVDYGGSTGYGRAYRERLRGRWGEVDVEDCVHAARHLVKQGLADAARLIIRGGSAGGYTTLAALAFHPGVFAAGACYYGVSDLEVLARDMHKFEARYLDGLIGPYPEARALYIARSPIHAVDRLSCALILLQGADDMVVPPNQSRMMADAVRAKGLPVAFLLFEGEQHGFRKAESIIRSLEAELAFYGAVFGFAPADALPPLTIDNVDAWQLRSQS